MGERGPLSIGLPLGLCLDLLILAQSRIDGAAGEIFGRFDCQTIRFHEFEGACREERQGGKEGRRGQHIRSRPDESGE